MKGQNRKKNTPKLGAFVLAAGEGRRLRPATLKTPKAAIPFCGVPLVCLATAKLAPLGPLKIVVNTHYLPGQVEDALDDLSVFYAGSLPDIVFSRESVLLNTGGGLRRGCQLIPDCADVIVHNADVMSDYPLSELIAAHRTAHNLATLLLIPEHGPKTVSLACDGIIKSFREMSSRDHYTFSGIYVFNRKILDFLPETPAPSIVEAFETALTAGERVMGVVASPEYFWSDLGTPKSYIDTHGLAATRNWQTFPAMQIAIEQQRLRQIALQKNGITLTGSVAVGKDVTIPAGTRLHNCVLWDRVSITEPMEVSTAVITQGIQITPPSKPRSTPTPEVFKTLGISINNTQFTPLPEQGSGRRYARLSTSDPDHSWMWSSYSHDRPENAYAAACAEFMVQCGVKVPKVFLHMPETGELVVEDLGDVRLLDISDPSQQLHFLKHVIDQIARFHSQAPHVFKHSPLPLQKSFDRKLYTWERTYFQEETLDPIFKFGNLWTPEVEKECQRGQDMLIEAEQTIIHRDLQSANIMVKNNLARIIDFQGMRFGVGVYDVASLLFDPYMKLGPEQRVELWQHYLDCVDVYGGSKPTESLLAAAATQRLLQALGAYGKLWKKDGREWFKPHIHAGLKMLKDATENTPSHGALHVLAMSLLGK